MNVNQKRKEEGRKMKHTIICIGRQYGSGGREIGRKLSESLGFAYYDRELLKLAAERK